MHHLLCRGLPLPRSSLTSTVALLTPSPISVAQEVFGFLISAPTTLALAQPEVIMAADGKGERSVLPRHSSSSLSGSWVILDKCAIVRSTSLLRSLPASLPTSLSFFLSPSAPLASSSSSDRCLSRLAWQNLLAYRQAQMRWSMRIGRSG